MIKPNKPEISVVIPAYNEAKYLPKCLESIIKQTFNNYEIIVVDNNSTDNTAWIARSFGARVVKEKIQGMIPARERGFREAKAEIIARTDADTVVTKDWLEKIFRTFQTNPEVIALSGPIFNSWNLLNILGKIYSTCQGIYFFYLTGKFSNGFNNGVWHVWFDANS